MASVVVLLSLTLVLVHAASAISHDQDHQCSQEREQDPLRQRSHDQTNTNPASDNRWTSDIDKYTAQEVNPTRMATATGIKRVSADKAALAADLATFVVEAGRAAIADHGYFSVAFSGGSLPTILSLGLDSGTKADVDTAKWKVFFADERCVPLDHEDSNYRVVRAECLDKIGVPQANVFAINPEVSPSEAAKEYEAQIVAELGPSPTFDLLLLGMGPDGHTCSLFPGHELLKVDDCLVASIADSPKPPPNRITLTYKAINQAKSVAFVCAGAGKADTLQQAFEPTPEQQDSVLPVQLVKAEQVVWFMDEPAAAKISH
eukprot:m.122967 g.122967  ORF g.122967 m.122967 type:complete len:318 (-) comp13742_c1_seq8:3620-4573(-)